jgi:hypothetical protein
MAQIFSIQVRPSLPCSADGFGEAPIRTPGQMVEEQIHFGEFAREDEILHSLWAVVLSTFAARVHDRLLIDAQE